MQVCLQNSEKHKEQNIAQMHAYNIAMSVINKLDDEIRYYRDTGEIKDCPIIFDEEGYIMYI